MLKHITILFFQFAILQANASNAEDTVYIADLIDSVKVMPKNIYPTDSVVFIDFVTLPNDFQIGDKTIERNGDSIKISCQYYLSNFSFVTKGSDTFNLGLFDPGTYRIYFTAKEYINIDYDSAIDTTSLTFTVSTPTNVPETVRHTDFTLYPNPTTNQLNISVSANIQPQTISIFDINGRKLQELKYTPQLDVTALSAGIYFIEATTGTGVVRRKFIKE